MRILSRIEEYFNDFFGIIGAQKNEYRLGCEVIIDASVGTALRMKFLQGTRRVE